PLAGSGRGVVEAHVLDRVLADLPTMLLERQLLAVDDGLGLRPRVTLERQAGIDGQVRGAGATASTGGAPTAAAAARGNTEGKSHRKAAGSCHGTYSQDSLLRERSPKWRRAYTHDPTWRNARTVKPRLSLAVAREVR